MHKSTFMSARGIQLPHHRVVYKCIAFTLFKWVDHTERNIFGEIRLGLPHYSSAFHSFRLLASTFFFPPTLYPAIMHHAPHHCVQSLGSGAASLTCLVHEISGELRIKNSRPARGGGARRQREKRLAALIGAASA